MLVSFNATHRWLIDFSLLFIFKIELRSQKGEQQEPGALQSVEREHKKLGTVKLKVLENSAILATGEGVVALGFLCSTKTFPLATNRRDFVSSPVVVGGGWR